VLFAKSVAGAPMVPISWEFMQCSQTKLKEARKVARVPVQAE
jgi:exosome complex component CSL4